MASCKPSDYFESDAQIIAQFIDKEDISIISSKINKLNINMQGKDGLTFIFYAFLNRKKQSFKWLVENGADVDLAWLIRDQKSTHLINQAVKLEDSYYFDLLLKVAMLNATDEDGSQATHNAIMTSQFGRLKSLLDAGADINGKNRNGDTPLLLLLKLSNYDDAYQILKRGADLKVADKMGNTVAYIIQDDKLPPTSESYSWWKKIKDELIKQGVKFPVKKEPRH